MHHVILILLILRSSPLRSQSRGLGRAMGRPLTLISLHLHATVLLCYCSGLTLAGVFVRSGSGDNSIVKKETLSTAESDDEGLLELFEERQRLLAIVNAGPKGLREKMEALQKEQQRYGTVKSSETLSVSSDSANVQQLLTDNSLLVNSDNQNEGSSQSVSSEDTSSNVQNSRDNATRSIFGSVVANCQCGVPLTGTFPNRIVGGDLAGDMSKFSSTCAITVKRSRGFVQFCGGTLICDRFVLTASHCIFNEPFFVIFSQYNICGSQTNWKAIAVKSKTKHEGFDSNTLSNDVALLELEIPVSGMEEGAIVTSCEPLVHPAADSSVTVVGWGTDKSGGTPQCELNVAQVNLIDSVRCTASYPGMITESMFCAAAPGKDTCQGDSGGPVFFPVPETDGCGGQFMRQIGITSWGFGCANPAFPGVYTRLALFRDWIAARTLNFCKTCRDSDCT